MLILAIDADLPEAVALINASYRGESSRRGWTHEADYIDGERTTLAELRADLAANDGANLYVARDEAPGPLLGCVWLERRDETTWYLGLLTVRTDLQAKQLGRAMLSEAEALVRTAGGAVVGMTVVHVRDSLIAWYQRRGYRLTGETLPYPYGGPVRDDLHFVVLEKRL